MAVRADLNISLDGHATTIDGTPDNPMGNDWGRLVASYAATKTFRRRVLGITDGSGTTHLDNDHAQRYFDNIGAEIIGAGMFGLHANPDDPNWSGWWGDNPPFGVPVFVLTHHQRPSRVMQGGTTFHFRSAPIEQVLDEARTVAEDRDVRIGGGLSVVNDYLSAGLIDHLHVAVAPIVLGQGQRLWDRHRRLEDHYDVSVETSPSATTHITFTKQPPCPATA